MAMHYTPRILSKPENKTLEGKERIKHRMFNLQEIEFLKQPMYQRFAKQDDLGSIAWNFQLKFKWSPNKMSLKKFYEKKTYQWAWEENVLKTIPEEKHSRTYNRIEPYEEDIKQALQDPYFGSCEKNFKEFIEGYCELSYVKNMFSRFRSKYGFALRNYTKEEQEKIITILKNSKKDAVSNFLNISKLFDNLTYARYNQYAKKAGAKFITPKQYKTALIKQKAEQVHVTDIEVRYNIDGKFYVDSVKLPQNIIEQIKNSIAEKM